MRAYAVVTGVAPPVAELELRRALGPLGARRDRVAAILTRQGWGWEPAHDVARFLATHTRGRYVLTWDGHYAAMVDGVVDGPVPRLAFMGAWWPPGVSI